MQLSNTKIKQALDQLEPHATVVPENHPSAGALRDTYGSHTFFLDEDGLEIIEPFIDEAQAQPQDESGQVMRVAIWNDAARTALAPLPAEATGVVVHFPAPRDRIDQAGEDSFPASDPTPPGGVTGQNDFA